MDKASNLPFALGTTLNDEDADGNYTKTELEGVVVEVEDRNWNSNPATYRSGKRRKLMIVRNNSGISLLPKRLAAITYTVGKQARTPGYTTVTAAKGFPIDEFLPSTGVADKRLYYVCIEGPALCKMPLSNLSADVAVGDKLVAITGATSQCTTSGRITAIDLTGATILLADQIRNEVGQAMSTKLTNNTNDDILVDIGPSRW